MIAILLGHDDEEIARIVLPSWCAYIHVPRPVMASLRLGNDDYPTELYPTDTYRWDPVESSHAMLNRAREPWTDVGVWRWSPRA
jgi:hypothetical protein